MGPVRRYRDALKRSTAYEISLSATSVAGASKLVDSRSLPDASAIRREEANALKDTKARLPDDYQRVLELRCWGGLSFVAMLPKLDRSPGRDSAVARRPRGLTDRRP